MPNIKFIATLDSVSNKFDFVVWDYDLNMSL